MGDFGVVCEFNPFHNGHARLFSEARRMGAERIVCLMSGYAVQRGELAVADTYLRAEIAVRAGADLVLELPYPWSAASAEYFSAAAMQILPSFASDVIFGSECGDIAYLQKAAKEAGKDEFRFSLQERLENGEGAAYAYFEELEKRGFQNLGSNDILGVEYMRKAREFQAPLRFWTIQREGAAYRENELKEGQAPSASALRLAMAKGSQTDLSAYMPKEAAELLSAAQLRGELTDPSLISEAVLFYFRTHRGEDLAACAEAGGGLSNRICSLAKEVTSTEELFEALKTKRYTDAKLRRAMLFSLTDIRTELLSQAPRYVKLLAANEKGRELLSKTRRTRHIPVITKPADAPSDAPQRQAEERLYALFSLARKRSTPADEIMKKNAFML